MTQPVGPGWITGHLAAKHPVAACVAACCCCLAAVSPEPVKADPTKIAVITFDDGNLSDITLAAPIISEYDWKATAYVTEVSEVEVTSPLDRQMLNEKWGWELGYHTRSHQSLPALEDAALAEEIGAIGGAFAAPFGEYDDRVVEAIKAAGYTSNVGNSDMENVSNPLPIVDPFRIQRTGYKVGFDLHALCVTPRAENDPIVITFHQVVPEGATDWQVDADALDEFVRCLKEQGYTPKTISELAPLGGE